MTEIIHKQNEYELYFWDKAAYLKHKFFFEKCLFHFEGEFAGEPFILNDWQDDWVANFYGWRLKETGLRRYREGAIWIAKGGGKTEFAAGLCLDGICNDDEPSAEGYVGAKSRKQADSCYTKAQRFVENSPFLKDKFTESYGELIYRRKIVHPTSGLELWDTNIFGAVSAEGKNFHGKSPHIAVLDEIWNQTDSELYSALSKSRRSRRQPIFITIGTAGERKNEFAWDRWCYDQSVLRDSLKNPHYLVKIYALDPKDDWTDEKNWLKANPSLGITPKLEVLRDEFLKARESPRLQNDFKQFHLNIWVSSSSSWLNQEKWLSCGSNEYPQLLGTECVAALDMSLTTDLTALVLVFKKDGVYWSLPFFFMPRETIKARSFDDQVPYEQWMQDGYIIPCEGALIDQNQVVDKILELKKLYKIKQLIVDPWKAAYVAQRVEKDIPDIGKFEQTVRNYGQPSSFFESLIIEGKLKHPNNPVLNWMATNVEVYRDNNDNMRPVKPEGLRGRNQRIDGIVALVMACSAFMAGAEKDKLNSVYKDRGLLIV
jgi:phage terminase large subunit-like protein